MNLPIAIIDARAPKEAIVNLEKEFAVYTFITSGITYDAISGHPDVFVCQLNKGLIVAPNIPIDCIRFLQKKSISFTFGKTKIDETLQNSSAYNCIETNSHFFHKQGFTDEIVIKNSNSTFINLPQSYTRCSMVSLHSNSFITSDVGIFNVMQQNKFNCLYCNPNSIKLPPYPHGFIGGCLGVYNNTVYVIGNFDYIECGDKIRTFIKDEGMKVVELYNGPLYDGGGVVINSLSFV